MLMVADLCLQLPWELRAADSQTHLSQPPALPAPREADISEKLCLTGLRMDTVSVVVGQVGVMSKMQLPRPISDRRRFYPSLGWGQEPLFSQAL